MVLQGGTWLEDRQPTLLVYLFISLVLLMPQEIYVMEVKYGHTAQEAMEQLHTKDYATKWKHDSRPVRLLGINISKETRTVDDWLCESCE